MGALQTSEIPPKVLLSVRKSNYVSSFGGKELCVWLSAAVLCKIAWQLEEAKTTLLTIILIRYWVK